METNNQTVILKGQAYDIFKRSAQVILPAIGTLYFALAQIWGLPRAEDVVGTIAAVNLFVGALVGISKSQYNKSGARFGGSIDVQNPPGVDTKVYSLNLFSDPEELDKQKEITFRVNPPH